MIDDLEPLGVQRSLSVPISGPKGSLRPSNYIRSAQAASLDKGASKIGSCAGTLDEEEQLLAVFRLAVWICRRPNAVLSRAEKAALLVHAISNMNSLSMMTRSVSALAQMVQMGQGDLLELCVAMLCLGEAKLLKGLQTLMTSIAQPQAIAQGSRYLEGLEGEKGPEEAADDAQKELQEVRAFVKEERSKHREVLRLWIQQAQGLLIWLVDRQRGCAYTEPALFALRAISSQSPWAAQLHERCITSPQTWVEHLSFLLNGYIGYTKALMELEATLEEGSGPTASPRRPKAGLEGSKMAEADENAGEDLVPLKVAKSLSLPIAR